MTPLVSLLGSLVTVTIGVLIVFTLARILPGVVARPLVRLMLSRKHRNSIPQVRRPCKDDILCPYCCSLWQYTHSWYCCVQRRSGLPVLLLQLCM